MQTTLPLLGRGDQTVTVPEASMKDIMRLQETTGLNESNFLPYWPRILAGKDDHTFLEVLRQTQQVDYKMGSDATLLELLRKNIACLGPRILDTYFRKAHDIYTSGAVRRVKSDDLRRSSLFINKNFTIATPVPPSAPGEEVENSIRTISSELQTFRLKSTIRHNTLHTKEGILMAMASIETIIASLNASDFYYLSFFMGTQYGYAVQKILEEGVLERQTPQDLLIAFFNRCGIANKENNFYKALEVYTNKMVTRTRGKPLNTTASAVELTRFLSIKPEPQRDYSVSGPKAIETWENGIASHPLIGTDKWFSLDEIIEEGNEPINPIGNRLEFGEYAVNTERPTKETGIDRQVGEIRIPLSIGLEFLVSVTDQVNACFRYNQDGYLRTLQDLRAAAKSISLRADLRNKFKDWAFYIPNNSKDHLPKPIELFGMQSEAALPFRDLHNFSQVAEGHYEKLIPESDHAKAKALIDSYFSTLDKKQDTAAGSPILLTSSDYATLATRSKAQMIDYLSQLAVLTNADSKLDSAAAQVKINKTGLYLAGAAAANTDPESGVLVLPPSGFMSYVGLKFFQLVSKNQSDTAMSHVYQAFAKSFGWTYGSERMNIFQLADFVCSYMERLALEVSNDFKRSHMWSALFLSEYDNIIEKLFDSSSSSQLSTIKKAARIYHLCFIPWRPCVTSDYSKAQENVVGKGFATLRASVTKTRVDDEYLARSNAQFAEIPTSAWVESRGLSWSFRNIEILRQLELNNDPSSQRHQAYNHQFAQGFAEYSSINNFPWTSYIGKLCLENEKSLANRIRDIMAYSDTPLQRLVSLLVTLSPPNKHDVIHWAKTKGFGLLNHYLFWHPYIVAKTYDMVRFRFGETIANYYQPLQTDSGHSSTQEKTEIQFRWWMGIAFQDDTSFVRVPHILIDKVIRGHGTEPITDLDFFKNLYKKNRTEIGSVMEIQGDWISICEPIGKTNYPNVLCPDGRMPYVKGAINKTDLNEMDYDYHSHAFYRTILELKTEPLLSYIYDTKKHMKKGKLLPYTCLAPHFRWSPSVKDWVFVHGTSPRGSPRTLKEIQCLQDCGAYYNQGHFYIGRNE